MQSKFITKVLAALKAKPVIGGLEISDSMLRFARWNGTSWDMTATRLPQGAVSGGEVKDRDALLRALVTLHSQIVGHDVHARVNVIVSLSAVNIYAQVFSLPLLPPDELEKAIVLNAHMISPGNIADVYSGFQVVKRDEEKFITEVLVAFLSKRITQSLNQVLQEAGFTIVAIESRALSLARFARKLSVGTEIKKPYLLTSIDTDGLDVLVMRNGELYFDYFCSWRDVQDNGREISLDTFRATIARNIHQVINFYAAHWSEPLQHMLYLTGGLHEEVEQTIRGNFSFPLEKLTAAMEGEVPQEWFVALGAGYRGTIPRGMDQEISLLGIDAQEQFRREETIRFLRFWRVVVPVALGILLATFFAADFSLTKAEKVLKASPTFHVPEEQLAAIGKLEHDAREFNALVSMMQHIEQNVPQNLPIFDKLFALIQGSRITLSRLTMQSEEAPLTLSGTAPSQDVLLEFKRALEANPMLKSVELPLSNVQSGPQGVTFSMSFSLKSPKTP